MLKFFATRRFNFVDTFSMILSSYFFTDGQFLLTGVNIVFWSVVSVTLERRLRAAEGS